MGVSRGRWTSVLRREITSLAHVSLELIKDDPDVRDIEVTEAAGSSPAREAPPGPASLPK
jgi:hypothetical protein